MCEYKPGGELRAQKLNFLNKVHSIPFCNAFFWWRRGITLDYLEKGYIDNVAIPAMIPGMATTEGWAYRIGFIQHGYLFTPGTYFKKQFLRR